MSTVKSQSAGSQLTNRRRLSPSTVSRVHRVPDDVYIMTLILGNKKITVYPSDQIECFKHLFIEGYVLRLTKRPKDKSV